MESGSNMRCEIVSQYFRMYLIHEQCASVQNHEVFVFSFDIKTKISLKMFANISKCPWLRFSPSKASHQKAILLIPKGI